MSGGFESAINEMMAELARQQEAMVRLHDGMKSIRGTATSPKRQLSVVVDARGQVSELKFLGQAYRTMSGPELATLIVATIEDAQRDARDRVAGHVGAPGMAGLDVRSALDGDIDWSQAFSHMTDPQQPLIELMRRPAEPGPADPPNGPTPGAGR
jgi:DNA-binding protein YbaB